MDLNSAYILDRYRDFQAQPQSFDAEWQAFFAQARREGILPDEAPPPPKPAAPPTPNGIHPLQGVALRIAQNMEQSLQIPSATSYREVPVKLLEENRILINSFLSAADAGKLSFTHLIGWAIVKALLQFPSLNHSFVTVDGKPAVAQHPDVNLGLAIDVERAGGTRTLVVPNVKKANTLDFAAFRTGYEAQVEKARKNKLSPDDLMGTTVTLTNPGTIGTIASVPRLMAGQGMIVATGGIHLPAEFQAAEAETLASLGVSKVMFVSSTYDHRIIQGAESGMFLAYVERLLLGEEGFYEEVFRSLRIPYRPLGWQRDRRRQDLGETQQQVLSLIGAFRSRGYLQTHLDPLGYELHYHPDLDPVNYDLTIWDLDRSFLTGGLGGQRALPLRKILDILRDTYSQRIGVEYMHIQPPEERGWLQQRMETCRNQPGLTVEEKGQVLRKLSEAETFERFLATKYLGHKRFSLEGAETTIPMLDELIHQAGAGGVREVVLGMAHRGRLNVLATIIGKNPKKIFAEFEDQQDPDSVHGTGDVKYHVGATGMVKTRGGENVELRLSPNPSHLEAVDPVVEGLVRARQDTLRDHQRLTVLPVLIHGDAAFAGQGVVPETLNLSQLVGYRTGGTIHLVINNQIGFTASPEVTRSMTSATDIAKMIEAPILHVNGDDPEAAVHAMRLAFEYRQKFRRDVVVDLVCYRRHGHNETDDPSYTQPVMYRKIRNHPPTRRVYTDRLLRNRVLTKAEVDGIESEFNARLEELLAATRAEATPADVADPLAPRGSTSADWPDPDTGAKASSLERSLEALSRVPADIEVNPKLLSQIEKRREGRIDWALAEQLAFGTLLLDGHPVRLSGQDSGRGTFSQRHSVLLDQRDGRMYIPLQHLSDRQAAFQVYDSPLSEYAVLGFEYGYAVAQPDALVMWEAQFGDFFNGAQIIIDQFLSSGEDKWNQTCGLVLLLPHGFEGQGPEHSSARLERFLTLCAGGNLQVVVPTTPAQYFHVLRRQVVRPLRKPLVVMTPKSLLRHPKVLSGMEDLQQGRFQTVLADDVAQARRVVLCSGKLYYDLLQARQDASVALVRIEQLYPLPVRRLRELLGSVQVPVVWAQEEPRNMGAWPFLEARMSNFLPPGRTLEFVGRLPNGSPATGSHHQHAREQAAIVERALSEAGAPQRSEAVPDPTGKC
ncbi:MAG TPA: multifunctional oxoglutarate decarboxylase/oxoglutarate dehydrogenase thiamine pyrophosphate-binding subunit/dihydrolipoyllysine-residue succinyltransferase subunit [Candidatus Xenobia bacterium]|jgi:2-oxoglutarate dehydrogenase E1 component